MLRVLVVDDEQQCRDNMIECINQAQNGFEIIGFDLYSYSNDDPEKCEVRIEMGKKLI